MKKTTFLSTLLIAFGISNSLHAAIVYNDIADETLGTGGNIEIDFDGGGSEFTFADNGMNSVEPGIVFNSQNHHLTTVSANEWDVLNGLNAGVVINANIGFYDQGDAYIDPFWGTTSFPTTDTYLGAQFKIGANTHYGWILVNWNAAGTFIVKSYAYNDVPNEAINAGQTSSSTASLISFESINISMYPNPCSETLTINLNAATNADLSIYNLSGKKVMDLTMNTETKVDVSNLNSGTYIIQIATNQEVIQKNIVIK